MLLIEATDQAYAKLRENFDWEAAKGAFNDLDKLFPEKIAYHPIKNYYRHKRNNTIKRLIPKVASAVGAVGAGVYGAHKVNQYHKAHKSNIKGAFVGGYRGAKKTQSLHGAVSKIMGQGRLQQLKSRVGGAIKGAIEGSKIGYNKGYSYLNKNRGRIFSDSADINVYRVNKKPVAMRVYTYNKKLGRKHKYIR